MKKKSHFTDINRAAIDSRCRLVNSWAVNEYFFPLKIACVFVMKNDSFILCSMFIHVECIDGGIYEWSSFSSCIEPKKTISSVWNAYFFADDHVI
jgi:hypothetical protein